MRTVMCRAGGLGVCRGSPGTTQLSRSPHSPQVSPTINYVCRSQALLGDPRGHLPPAAFPCTLKRLRNRTGSILETAKLSQGVLLSPPAPSTRARVPMRREESANATMNGSLPQVHPLDSILRRHLRGVASDISSPGSHQLSAVAYTAAAPLTRSLSPARPKASAPPPPPGLVDPGRTLLQAPPQPGVKEVCSPQISRLPEATHLPKVAVAFLLQRLGGRRQQSVSHTGGAGAESGLRLGSSWGPSESGCRPALASASLRSAREASPHAPPPARPRAAETRPGPPRPRPWPRPGA